MSIYPARFPLLDVNRQPVWWLSPFYLDLLPLRVCMYWKNRPFLLTNRGRL